MTSKTLKIDGMKCEKCSAKVNEALTAVPGVTGVTVYLDKGKAKVEMDGDIDDETLCMAVVDAGFKAKVKHGLF